MVQETCSSFSGDDTDSEQGSGEESDLKEPNFERYFYQVKTLTTIGVMPKSNVTQTKKSYFYLRKLA